MVFTDLHKSLILICLRIKTANLNSWIKIEFSVALDICSSKWDYSFRQDSSDG